ncbi:Alpha/Beta hydrolase protein [Dactylonectria macrodidyma]|uniref:Alpha/Beta hydrolase protein n=1 Tax=Dactylonectria macrodidyma TaxID=307937 RepID=A0A9P9INU7_9HYPO|nr:Alpha/Beta hydrolase protein [Dactylonectria macrodidyma]
MAGHGFFQYLRLKFLATFFRLMSLRRTRAAIATDLAISDNPVRKLVRIPSRDAGRFIEAWLYSPPGADQAKRPLIVNWHGSGFILPMFGTDVAFCSLVARETGVFVLDADYRKGPEVPFPGAVHDIEDTLKWVANQTEQFDLSRIGVSGFSAGANLALVAASSLRKAAPLELSLVIAVYPPTDISIDPAAKTVPNPIKPIPAAVADIFNDCYTPDAATRTDPRVSPSYADPASYPPTVAIFTCEGDTLAPEAIRLAEKLDDGQRKVININLKGVPHAFNHAPEPGSNDWEQREILHNESIKVVKEAFEL